MEKLKIGANIKTHEDIRNLIVGLINRSNEFELDFILRLTIKYMQGSSVEISERKIKTMINEILDLFQKENIVTCNNGIYKTTPVHITIVEYQLTKNNTSHSL